MGEAGTELRVYVAGRERVWPRTPAALAEPKQAWKMLAGSSNSLAPEGLPPSLLILQ